MQDRVTIGLENGIADVRLNRPDKRNALDMAMLEAIAAAGEALRVASGLRAVIISGAGQGFCAGLDVANFTSGLPFNLMIRSHGASNPFQHVAMLWRELPVPVIAAIHGACLGGGLQIALGADIRLVAPDTAMSFMEINWGLVPDMGAFVLTRGIVRDDSLRDLVYTGRTVNAQEAVTLGLATRIADDPLAQAHALATAIAMRNPDAIRAAKSLFGKMQGSDAAAAILAAESAAQSAILARPNQREAVMAAVQQRPPLFTD